MASGSCAGQHSSKAIQMHIKFREALVWRMPGHAFPSPNKPLIVQASALYYIAHSAGLTTSLTGNKDLVYMVVTFTTKLCSEGNKTTI